ncbi:MAG: EexN family lipoprotein [Gammaproteobacteria bacterium]
MPRLIHINASLLAFRPVVVLFAAAGLLMGCEEEAPRSYSEYLEDPIAREATLLRCNASRDASRGDAECINAKRAAAALAAKKDADKRRRFEAESERKRTALRERIAAREAAERQQLSEMKRRANAAYEQRWSENESGAAVTGGYPEQDVYGGRQFPAVPLQPGVSASTEQESSNAVAGYMGGEVQPGYSLSNGTSVIEPLAADAPVRELPEESFPEQGFSEEGPPEVSSLPTADGSAVPEPQQVIEGSSAADPSWQPFEPPAVDQPGEG